MFLLIVLEKLSREPRHLQRGLCEFLCLRSSSHGYFCGFFIIFAKGSIQKAKISGDRRQPYCVPCCNVIASDLEPLSFNLAPGRSYRDETDVRNLSPKFINLRKDLMYSNWTESNAFSKSRERIIEEI